jgi:hypothetical protein
MLFEVDVMLLLNSYQIVVEMKKNLLDGYWILCFQWQRMVIYQLKFLFPSSRKKKHTEYFSSLLEKSYFISCFSIGIIFGFRFRDTGRLENIKFEKIFAKKNKSNTFLLLLTSLSLSLSLDDDDDDGICRR